MVDSEEMIEKTDEAKTEIDSDDEVTPLKERFLVEAPENAPSAALLSSSEVVQGTFVASLRERFAAFFIDTAFLFYLYWIFTSVYRMLFLKASDAEIPYTGWHGFALHGSFLIICFLYYFICEGIFLVTIGKLACRMSVSKKNGRPASLVATFFRNLLRPVDYILIVPVIFIMELTGYHQRLGDLVSGTTVVKKFGLSRDPYKLSGEIIASATGRTVAIFIDLFFFALFFAGYLLLFNSNAPLLSKWLLLLSPLVVVLYFVLIEMVTETSPGNFIAGYRICHDSGRRLTLSGALIRTLWLPLDITPVGILSIFLSTHKQRFGDLAAGTVVIKEKRSWRTALSMLIAVVCAVGTLYLGFTNENNALSKKFRINFLPEIGIINDLGLEEPVQGQVVMQNFRFAANEPTDYRVPPTFTAGETVYLVFELKNYVKKERKVWLQEDLSVTYPDGSVGLKQFNIVDYKEVILGYAPIEFTNNITLPMNSNPGEYIVNLTIRDKFGGSEVKETKVFYVKENYFSN